MGPALAMVPGDASLITTSLVEAAHDPLLMVHLRVVELPATKPVTVDVGEEGVVIVALPDTTLHVPVPTEGVLAFKLVVLTLHRF